VVVTSELEGQRTVSAYVQRLDAMLNALNAEAVLSVGACLQRTREAGGTIYLAGNGGSAATASHWANDLGKATRIAGVAPVRVVSLGDHLSWLTALANDEGYERVFAGQLENLVRPGDVLVVLSASGNSPNLVEAVRTAQARGATTVALLGFDGGVLKDLVDHYVWVPSPKGAYGPVEDIHLVVCHVLTTCLANGSLAGAVVPQAGTLHREGVARL
jgi:D-sedoheptulose 7-phosphate isomerase